MNGLPLTIPRQLALFERIVPRFLVKLAGAIQNIGLVDLLHPVARPDFLNRYGNGFVSDPSKRHHVFNDYSVSWAFCCSDRPGCIFTMT